MNIRQRQQQRCCLLLLVCCLSAIIYQAPCCFVTGFGRYPTLSSIHKSPIPWEYYRLKQSSSSSSSPSSSGASKSGSASGSGSDSSTGSGIQKSVPQLLQVNNEIREMELQILASAREKRDFDRVARALREQEEEPDVYPKKAGTLLVPGVDQRGTAAPVVFESQQQKEQEQLQVALAATLVTTAISFLLFSNVFVTAILSAVVFWSANSDPLDNDNSDENLMGAISRIVGRTTLQSYQQTTLPKVKAVARAVVGTAEHEIAQLKARINELEQDQVILQQENLALQNYKRQRQVVDELLLNSNRLKKLPELKQVARQWNLPVGGTKDQLLMRLVQAGVAMDDLLLS